jgi:amino acid transporter
MDFSRLTQGEKIAGISGVALILIMFIFKWFGLEATFPGFTAEAASQNAWHAYGWFLVLVLLVTGFAAVGLALMKASQSDVGLPVAMSAIVAGLGVVALLIIVISILSPPNIAGVDLPEGVDKTRKIGVWLGLLAAIGVTYGGWRAMQEEGASLGDQTDRFGERDRAPGAPPPPSSTPPPPPPSQAP